MKFRLLRVIGDPPLTLYHGDVVMNAPRPLLGTDLCEVTVTPPKPSLMGFTVVVMANTYRRDEVLEGNRRLDAQVVEWVPVATVLAQERARLVSLYDEEAIANVEAMMTEREWCDSWHNHFARGEIDIAVGDELAYAEYVNACRAEHLIGHDIDMWRVHDRPRGPLG